MKGFLFFGADQCFMRRQRQILKRRPKWKRLSNRFVIAYERQVLFSRNSLALNLCFVPSLSALSAAITNY